MDNFIPKSCRLPIKVEIRVPIYPKELQDVHQDLTHPNTTSISIINFQRNQFKYDATWFTKQFHTLDDVWTKQNGVVQKKLLTGK